MPATEDTVAVATWNTKLGGGDVSAFLSEEFRLSCGDSGPTVVASAPVPWTIDPERDPGPQLDIVELADRCGLSLIYVPSARNGPDTGTRPREDRGNAILSTLPLSAPAAIDLPFEASRRVAVAANIQMRGRPALRAVSLHLDVGAPLHRTLLTGNQTRSRQASGFIEAVDILEGRAPGVSATVVGADLNTWARKETAELLLRRAFPQSPPWDERGTRGSFPTDHLFFRSGGDDFHVSGYRVIESDYSSDHRARLLFLHR
jgi:endonuclease/exonuclease/phosphatase family metal-dependent hydrolase